MFIVDALPMVTGLMVTPVDQCSVMVSWNPLTLVNCVSNITYVVMVADNNFTTNSTTILITLDMLRTLSVTVRVSANSEMNVGLSSKDIDIIFTQNSEFVFGFYCF